MVAPQKAVSPPNIRPASQNYQKLFVHRTPGGREVAADDRQSCLNFSSKSRLRRSFSSSSAACDQVYSGGALKPPSLVNPAAGAGDNGKRQSERPFNDRSKALTWGGWIGASVRAAPTVGPSGTSPSCPSGGGG